MQADIVVIGAGVAGLCCARELGAAGARVTVLERARGVGGRCATRRVEAQPVDFGAVFLHGSDPDFVRAVEATEGATLLKDWPVVRAGAGTPCQPDAFRPGEQRAAFAEGISAFPKSLASGLDVRLGTRVTSLALGGGGLRLTLGSGEPIAAATVVLALPTEDTLELLAPLRQHNDEMLASCRLLEMISSMPSLTVLAGYPLDTVEPEWHVSYPEQSELIHLISHDSSKRPNPRFRVFVYQALAGWSRAHAGLPSPQWSSQLVEEAGRLLGSWAASPAWMQAHAWHRARVDRGNELTSPILVELRGGARVGLAGEVFAPGGGVEAAWLSGRNLARRIAGGMSS